MIWAFFLLIMTFNVEGVFMYNILIVEDNDIQRKNLRTMIEESGNLYFVLESGNVKDALEVIEKHLIHLFYLDINLQDDSGLELAKKIRTLERYKLTWIIFITSHVKFMIEAFKDVHCYDYVLKPLEKDTVKRLTKDLLQNEKQTDVKNDYFFLDINGIFFKVYLNDILFIETYKKMTRVHTYREKYEAKNLPLSKILNLIQSDSIIQSHRSYAVNVDHIRSINKNTLCWEIYFDNYTEKALLGNKFRTQIMSLCGSI